MLNAIIRFFWPDIKDTEIKKFGLLSITFFTIIGSYWILRMLKDTVFMKIAFPENLGWIPEQGALFQPIAKMWSPVIIIACVLIYSKLVDLFKKHHLFYVLGSFYIFIFGTITTLLIIRSSVGDVALGSGILSTMGWVSYFSIESFGSIMVPLFWSFVISVTDPDSAKTGFPFIIAGAQLGSIGGSTLPIITEKIGSVWHLFIICIAMICGVMTLIYYFMRIMPPSQLVASKEVAAEEKAAEKRKKKESFLVGFYNGLKILFTRPYLLGVLIVSTAYEIVATIIDYQMKRQASLFPAYATEAGFAKFLGIFGVCVNTLAFLLALLGTSYLLKKYGLRVCILIYPITLGIAVLAFYLFFNYGSPTAGQLLWSTFAIVVLSRGLTYAINNPTKDMMYIPTGKDAKFKAKGWIDMFGSRSAKMTGARITNTFKHNVVMLITFGTIIGLGIVALWIFAALFVGKKNQQLIKEGKIIT
jgi:AAA family ATP:ADP antiporter